MTSTEIRATPICGEFIGLGELSTARSLDDCAQFLREIAAQLAEINSRENFKL